MESWLLLLAATAAAAGRVGASLARIPPPSTNAGDEGGGGRVGMTDKMALLKDELDVNLNQNVMNLTGILMMPHRPSSSLSYQNRYPKHPLIDCQYSRYGCCQDNLTPASGPGYDGCSILDTEGDVRCTNTVFGCCDDGQTQAIGFLHKGCPESIWRELDERQLGRAMNAIEDRNNLKDAAKALGKGTEKKHSNDSSSPSSSASKRIDLESLQKLDDSANWYTPA
mmetsp:Transcript_5718/g.11338  ORF Transcript_5718/g.11338 Transcript_5718/m.11338 type:complete len:225 (-) Transcript_5718:44-718(-)